MDYTSYYVIHEYANATSSGLIKMRPSCKRCLLFILVVGVILVNNNVLAMSMSSSSSFDIQAVEDDKHQSDKSNSKNENEKKKKSNKNSNKDSFSNNLLPKTGMNYSALGYLVMIIIIAIKILKQKEKKGEYYEKDIF